MSSRAAAHIFVSGKVQGVGFRDFTERRARLLQLKGYTRNLSDGRVEIEVEGERDKIDGLIQSLWQGPPGSRVTAVDVSWESSMSRFSDFSIRL